jgi:hypothetical protein
MHFAELLPSRQTLSLVASPECFESLVERKPQSAIDVSLSLFWLSAAWRVSGRDEYREALLRWQSVLESAPALAISGFAVTNRDLVSGHLLLTYALMYELLADRVGRSFSDALLHAMREQAGRTYDDLTNPEVFPTYAYEQNHLIIPVCGLGMAAMVLEGKDERAAEYERFVSDFLQKSFDVIAHDGWFFEGISYWTFTMQFPLCYARMLKHRRGVDLFTQPPFRDSALYLAHSVLPDRRFVFDFSDWGPRTYKDGVGFQEGYDLPWHTKPTYLYQGLVHILKRDRPEGMSWPSILDELPAAPRVSPMDGALQLMAILDSEISPDEVEATNVPASHYFPDMEVLHWRSAWGDTDAVALAFKCGPPAGHYLKTLLPKHPKWKLELGHAHPDAGSFILFGHGRFLANDTGYIGAKETAVHNSILVDGIGQHKGGTPWSTFAGKPYEAYNKIRLESVWHDKRAATAEAVFDAAYDDALQLSCVRRQLILIDGRFLLVRDTLRSELPHEYTWLLHGDRAAKCEGGNRFIMENGPARLVIQSLVPTASFEIGSTIVETELFNPDRSRPQQRGYHLALRSPCQPEAGFLVAMGIQSAQEDAAAFTARLLNDETVEMSDTRGSCTLVFQKDPATSCPFTYTLR